MSVETALGISAEMAEGIIERRWSQWVSHCPALQQVDSSNLRGWLRTSDVDVSGPALYELAQLAPARGGDDVDAASVLAWAMLPTACRVANELRDIDPGIDAMVAAQLWIEIREFNWRASTRFVGNVRSSLRRGVLREYGLDPYLPPDEARLLSPDVLEWFCPDWVLPDEDPRKVLLAVLDWGVENGVIQASDRELLLDLVDESARDPLRHSPRRALLGSSELIVSKWGVSSRTVRRRGRRALDALAAHANELAELVPPLAS